MTDKPNDDERAKQWDARWSPDKPCPHVPARPDVDLTICWKCGVEIVADTETHLWRPLTANETLVRREAIRKCRDLFFAVPYAEYPVVLWEWLHINEMQTFRLAENMMGRWVIVHGGYSEDLAWSGSTWVPHNCGIPSGGAQICNFDTREDALTYAKETFEAAPGNITQQT